MSNPCISIQIENGLVDQLPLLQSVRTDAAVQPADHVNTESHLSHKKGRKGSLQKC